MTIKHAILTLDFEVDADGNPDAALEDILGAIRIALSGPVSIGAGAVELGAIVQSVEAWPCIRWPASTREVPQEQTLDEDEVLKRGWF